MRLQEVASRVEKGETVVFRASGHSMTPVIRDGDIVSVAPLALNERLSKGSVVLARVHGHWYLHNVNALQIKRGELLVQITNNKGRVNGWTHRKNVVGVLK